MSLWSAAKSLFPSVDEANWWELLVPIALLLIMTWLCVSSNACKQSNS